jgi:general secretion pathway protein H
MRQHGFTLIELLVVLVIASLVLVVVVPFGGSHRDRAELARSVDEMASALRMTRSRAIRNDRAEALLVDTGQARYRAAGGAGLGGFPTGTHLVLTTTEDEKQDDALGAIRFFPDGSSTGGGITIEKGTMRYDVLVDWLTGGVSVRGAKS